ncbi:hypothetical protein QE410_001501 [Microbacterium sp. SORGH_AS 1204]|nr:hypothetical protein [Microbacterium sp. SORGH_AS_1204]
MSSPSPAERFARASARSTHPHTADFAEMQRFELDDFQLAGCHALEDGRERAGGRSHRRRQDHRR